MLSYNKYDIGLVILIASLVVGDLGGALQPVRIISLFFLPQVLNQCRKISILASWSFVFFMFWLGYILCSLIWTSDISQGLKEVLYYVSHFSLFILVQYWCKKAICPIRSVVIGWLTFFLLSCPVAFYELFFDKHLPSSQYSAGLVQNVGDGYIYQKKFAALNFLNYNTYVTVLCFSSPFLFAYLLLKHNTKAQILGWICLMMLTYILLMNASRGGLVCLSIYYLFFLSFYKKIKFKGKRVVITVALITLLVGVVSYSDVLLEQVVVRFVAHSNLFDDSSRSHLILVALQLFMDSWGLGTGVGSLVASMKTLTSGIVITHNLFLEILVQYGVVIFMVCCMFFFYLFQNGKRQMKRSVPKFILYSSLTSFPFLFVINAGYLLMPSLWVYLSCLAFFSTYKVYDQFV